MKETVFRAHKKLDAWNEAVSLTLDIYKATEKFPKSETYGLAGQMRRAAVSVASNIAEGAARSGKKEFAQFLNMAGGSLSELDTQVEISFKLGYMTVEEKEALDVRMRNVARLIAGLVRWVRNRER